jgi:hypothetical protein
MQGLHARSARRVALSPIIILRIHVHVVGVIPVALLAVVVGVVVALAKQWSLLLLASTLESSRTCDSAHAFWHVDS